MTKLESAPEVEYPTLVGIEDDSGNLAGVLDEASVIALTDIAIRNYLTYGAAIEQAVINQNFIEKVAASGHRLLIQKPDESKLRLLELV